MNKQKCYAWTLSLATILGATACHEDISFSSGSNVGKISPQVELNTSVVRSSKTASRAEGESTVTANDLALKITSEDGKYSGSWTSLSAYPDDTEFPVGNYVVEALYGSADDEGFEKPAYYGSTNITVHEDETSPVTITASMVNTMISINYTDAFKKYMKSWSAQAHSAGGDYQYYAQDETRPCYVRPGNVTITVDFEKQNGVSASVYAAEFTAEARHHYTVTVDVNEGAVGDATLVVSYDDTVDQEDVTIDLSDEIMSAPAPTITGDGVADGQVFYFVEGSDLNDIKTNIIARGSLAKVNLTTQSEDLLAAGWPAEINLTAATAAQQQTLTDLGLKTLGLYKNADKMAVIDFTNVALHTKKAQFSIQVEDRYKKVSEVFSFEINVSDLQLEVKSTETFNADDTQLTTTLTYNGTEISALKIYYLGERGTYEAATNVTATRVGEGDEYTVSFDVPSTIDTVDFYAVIGNYKTDVTTVERDVEAVTADVINENGVFATKATITGLVRRKSALTQNPQLKYRKQGDTEWIDASATLTKKVLTAELSGLTGATTYEYVAALDGTALETIRTFTTEAAAQLPNAGMESWYTEQPYSKYQLLYYAGSSSSDCAWGTMNNLTTSTGGSGNSIFSYGGTSYRATSGTKSTSDCNNGSLAAVIRTVGWGSGNTAAGDLNGVCSNITAGELYLGSYNSSTESGNYGYTFASRPISLSFYYKYTTVSSGNGDYGVAEIKIKDASGNVIASNTMNVPEASAYTLATLALEYPENAAKCASIEVNFKSSGNSSALSKNTSFLSDPGFGNYTDGEYVGSQLYIDDITLNY